MYFSNKIWKIIFWFAVAFIIAIVVLAIAGSVVAKKEGLFTGSPDRLVYRGPYYFHDYGFGTNLINVNWSLPQPWQPFVPVNTGLYDESCAWCPRNKRW
jgi:hypothetical protein